MARRLMPIKAPGRAGAQAARVERRKRAMAFKDLLVHLDGSDHAMTRLDYAATLAARHGAHLVGLHAVEGGLPAGLTSDMGGASLGLLLAQLRDAAEAEATRMRRAFEDRMRRDGLQGEWRQAMDMPAEAVALHARYADLAVLGQPEPGSALAAANEMILEAVLFTAGRPVLMLPYAGRFTATPGTVLVGWNASKEAARAVHDALPLLQAAAQVRVLAVNPRLGIGGHGKVPAADIALHLARHGVPATAQHATANEIRESDVLLNSAADLGAELLVMGAYGHSRLREMVLGGVTRSILGRMTLPVLLAH
jgi:nucleotide-binding universal stress UspA family protein